jgi:acetyl esterase
MTDPSTLGATDAPAYEARAAGNVAVRVYRPAAEPLDALLWAHGGGFVHGDLDMPEADWVARSLAQRGHLVVCVDYRLASDSVRYPAPSDDVLTAWRWLGDNRRELGVEGPLHLGGASAGGNLVTGAVVRMRDGDVTAGGAPLPHSLVLAYPTLHAVQPPASAELADLLRSLPEESRWGPEQVLDMYVNYLPQRPVASALDIVNAAPAAAVPGDADLTGFPPTFIVASEVDGLRTSAERFASRLLRAGIENSYFCEPGTLHGHLNRPEEPGALPTIERMHAWLTNHS